MRKGIEGLAAIAQDLLGQKATGGAVCAFRGRRGDLIKMLYFDGQGVCRKHPPKTAASPAVAW
jgi:transposase